jgi:hypothetical protein
MASDSANNFTVHTRYKFKVLKHDKNILILSIINT